MLRRPWFKALALFLIGGAAYAIVELLWRGWTHQSMFLLGGVCFLVLGALNEYLPWEMPLAAQVVIGDVLVTVLELATGLIVNVWLGLGVWDYSNLPGNICGQICPQFMVLWIPLVLVAILLDDLIRWLCFGEEKPKYRIL